MLNRITIWISLVCTFCMGQTSLSVKGLVRDRYSDAPIPGAVVSLIKTGGMPDTSKADGSYSLPRQASIVRGGNKTLPTVSGKTSFEQGRFLFSNDQAGVVKISIHDLNGKLVFSMNRFVDKGIFRLAPGLLPAGMLVCQIRTPAITQTITFVSLKDARQTLSRTASLRNTASLKLLEKASEALLRLTRCVLSRPVMTPPIA